MNIEKVIKVNLLLIVLCTAFSITLSGQSYAAIEIKAGTTRQGNVTANNAFQYCLDMRHQTSTLGDNSLDPHMSTARDWGATAYLGLSSYGTVRNATGDTTSINEKNYYTTTGNASGVINLGSYNGDWATFVAAYKTGTSSNDYCSKLYEETNSRYVDVLGSTYNSSENVGKAYGETAGWYNAKVEYGPQIGLRKASILGFEGWGSAGNGSGAAGVTYRPAIWN